MAATFERLREDPSWNTHVLDSAHNVLRDAPDEVLKIVLAAGSG